MSIKEISFLSHSAVFVVYFKSWAQKFHIITVFDIWGSDLSAEYFMKWFLGWAYCGGTEIMNPLVFRATINRI